MNMRQEKLWIVVNNDSKARTPFFRVGPMGQDKLMQGETEIGTMTYTKAFFRRKDAVKYIKGMDMVDYWIPAALAFKPK
jgi:hypothetical protein